MVDPKAVACVGSRWQGLDPEKHLPSPPLAPSRAAEHNAGAQDNQAEDDPCGEPAGGQRSFSAAINRYHPKEVAGQVANGEGLWRSEEVTGLLNGSYNFSFF
jgi:hypothetical protein